MNIFDNTSSSDVLKNFRIDKDDGGAKNRQEDLGKNEFMQLMIAQLNNQSPLDPQDNGEFISQLAQFSSLEEMQKLTKTVDDAMGHFRSTQALQASAMVGQSVVVANDRAVLGADGTVRGSVDVPAGTSNLTVSIMNPGGDLVRRMDLGPSAGGEVPFAWDGENMNGELMPPGEYKILAEGQFSTGPEQLQTNISANVDSVSLDKRGGITLNLAGMGAVPIGDVRQIN